MRRPKKTLEPSTERVRARSLAAFSKAMDEVVAPARDVLSMVRSVPTCMVQFDHATRAGGYPIEVVTIVSGPSSEGKTAFTLLLLKSFLELGHMGMLVDAERTTPMDWARLMIGEELANSDYFRAIRPDTYEETVEAVRKFCNLIKKMRNDKVVPEDTTGIVIVDSLRKLVPEGFFKAATKADNGQADPMSGRGPMIKAKWNTAWMDELTPLVDNTKTGFLAIAREYEKTDATEWEKKAGTDVKMGGGKAIYFDASVVIRITRAGWVGEKRTEDGPGDVYGERHRITIKKTKVGGKDGKVTECYFHTSNGTLVNAGHDRARDVIDLAKKFGIVEVNGSWVNWSKKRIGQGEHKAVVNLTKDESMLADLESKVRAEFATQEPVAFDPETGEIE
jgi:RecA/RadA recombinase